MEIVPERLYEAFDRVNEAGDGAYASDNKNGNVEEDVVPQQIPPLELQVEEARQEEAQARAGEAPSQTHEEGEMRDKDGHEQGEDYQGNSQAKTP